MTCIARSRRKGKTNHRLFIGVEHAGLDSVEDVHGLVVFALSLLNEARQLAKCLHHLGAFLLNATLNVRHVSLCLGLGHLIAQGVDRSHYRTVELFHTMKQLTYLFGIVDTSTTLLLLLLLLLRLSDGTHASQHFLKRGLNVLNRVGHSGGRHFRGSFFVMLPILFVHETGSQAPTLFESGVVRERKHLGQVVRHFGGEVDV